MTLVCEQCKIKKVLEGKSKMKFGVLATKLHGKCSSCKEDIKDLHFYKESKK